MWWLVAALVVVAVRLAAVGSWFAQAGCVAVLAMIAALL
jgi:hypothetical protein